MNGKFTSLYELYMIKCKTYFI